MSITINAVDPEIGGKIYSWLRDGEIIYRRRQAAEIPLERQITVVEALKEADIIVKVNTVNIPGINEDQVLEVSKKLAELSTDSAWALAFLLSLLPNRLWQERR